MRPVVRVGLQLALVEHHDDRLVGLDRRAEELLDGGVVVLLLRQHGHQHVGRLADRPGPLPVDRHVGIDVGRIEQQEPRRDRVAHAPEEAVLGRILERVVGRPPGDSLNGSNSRCEQGRIGQIRAARGTPGASCRRPAGCWRWPLRRPGD